MLAAYMTVITAVSLIFVQVIKTSVLTRFALDDASRIAWIALISYVINLGLLLGLLALSGDYNSGQLIFYLLAPFGQAGGSSLAYQIITKTQASIVAKQTPGTPIASSVDVVDTVDTPAGS